MQKRIRGTIAPRRGGYSSSSGGNGVPVGNPFNPVNTCEIGSAQMNNVRENGSAQMNDERNQNGFKPKAYSAPVAPMKNERNQNEFKPKAFSTSVDKPFYGKAAHTKVRVCPEDKEIFGEELEKKFAELELPRNRAAAGFVPSKRDVEEIFHEDEQHAAQYAEVIENDDEIFVDGLPGEFSRIENWNDAGFDETLLKNIKRAGYIKPRRIQQSAIPLILDGFDMKATAETGTGKTAAFLIPIISECIDEGKKGTFKAELRSPFAVILAPTRELAIQTYEQASKLATGTGVTVARAYGEYPVQQNLQDLAIGCDILCATPGRFKHFCENGSINVGSIKFLVFDEGDELLENAAIVLLDPVLKSLKDHQTLFFSATFEPKVLAMADKYMKESVHLYTGKNGLNKNCVQEFRLVDAKNKFTALLDYFGANGGNKRAFVFCKYKDMCEKLSIALTFKGIPALPLSGIRAQDLREKALMELRNNQVSVLVVTDVCSRGLDMKDLDLVFNFDMPSDLETYIHRAGRTGRLRRGKCLSFVSSSTDRALCIKLKESLKLSGQLIPPTLESLPEDAYAAETYNIPDAFKRNGTLYDDSEDETPPVKPLDGNRAIKGKPKGDALSNGTKAKADNEDDGW